MNATEQKPLHPAFETARKIAKQGKMGVEETEVNEKETEKQKDLNYD